MKKNNAPATNGNESAQTQPDSNTDARPLYRPLQALPAQTKQDRILEALKLPRGLNRFEAERLGDHVLNSTISKLRHAGWIIFSESEVVPTRFSPDGARVNRYRCVGRAT